MQSTDPSGRGSSTGAERSLVVVGLDPWVSSRAALRLGLAEARVRHGRLHVVVAYLVPASWPTRLAPVDTPEATRRHIAAGARGVLDEVLAAEEVEHPGTADVPVELRVEPGQAGPVLVAAAQRAALLVIGHHGHGALSTALLGSVGLHCLTHAPCPVTVVPAMPAPRLVRERMWSGSRP